MLRPARSGRPFTAPAAITFIATGSIEEHKSVRFTFGRTAALANTSGGNMFFCKDRRVAQAVGDPSERVAGPPLLDSLCVSATVLAARNAWA